MYYSLFKRQLDMGLIAKADSEAEERKFIIANIEDWKTSKTRKEMQQGNLYYEHEHDILDKKRLARGKDGILFEVKNLPNNKIIDNQYTEAVDQKTNYFLGQPLTWDVQDEAYAEQLKNTFDKRFNRTLRSVGVEALNCGIAWVYVYQDEIDGRLKFKRFDSTEVIAFWGDADHTVLDMVVRLYEIEWYINGSWDILEKVEVYKPDGVEHYQLKDGKLIPDPDNPRSDYIVYEDQEGPRAYNWGKIPIVAFKYNAKEIPLIRRVKTLQDAINSLLSQFKDAMDEDAHTTVLVIKNYDNQSLGELRQNLATYGAIKVRADKDTQGGVDTLHIEVDSSNYEFILKELRRAFLKNARSFDAKDDRLVSGTPNQMNIQSMYADIELDANGMETEFQASFEDLLYFVNVHLGRTQNDQVTIQFNRDMMMNESEIITNARNSMAIVSEETILNNHPWVTDVEEEQKRLKQERQETMDDYGILPGQIGGDAGGNSGRDSGEGAKEE